MAKMACESRCSGLNRLDCITPEQHQVCRLAAGGSTPAAWQAPHPCMCSVPNGSQQTALSSVLTKQNTPERARALTCCLQIFPDHVAHPKSLPPNLPAGTVAAGGGGGGNDASSNLAHPTGAVWPPGVNPEVAMNPPAPWGTSECQAVSNMLQHLKITAWRACVAEDSSWLQTRHIPPMGTSAVLLLLLPPAAALAPAGGPPPKSNQSAPEAGAPSPCDASCVGGASSCSGAPQGGICCCCCCGCGCAAAPLLYGCICSCGGAGAPKLLQSGGVAPAPPDCGSGAALLPLLKSACCKCRQSATSATWLVTTGGLRLKVAGRMTMLAGECAAVDMQQHLEGGDFRLLL